MACMMRVERLIFAAALAATFAGASGAQEKVCIEEAAGVCLKYRTVTPKPAPSQPAAKPAPGQPLSRDASAEAALRMTADERRAVQRSLQALGLYDGGVDGAFGDGTRRAIARWQIDRGFGSSGYLTLDQFRELKSPRSATAPKPTPAVATPTARTEPSVEVPASDPISGKVYKANFPKQIYEHAVTVVVRDDGIATLTLHINGRRARPDCEVAVNDDFFCTMGVSTWSRILSGKLPNISLNSFGQSTAATSVNVW